MADTRQVSFNVLPMLAEGLDSRNPAAYAARLARRFLAEPGGLRRTARHGALAMSTFFVLPSRPLLGQRFAEFLGSVFPGLPLHRADWPELAEMLDAEVLRRSGVYVVYREDVADGDTLDVALAREFGAEPGDEVVEVAPGGRLAVLTARRWRVGAIPRQAA
jgi:hypothetical protein